MIVENHISIKYFFDNGNRKSQNLRNWIRFDRQSLTLWSFLTLVEKEVFADHNRFSKSFRK